MDLNRKRDIFEQLTERLRELEEISIDDDDDSSDEEDLLGELIETPNDSVDSRSAEHHGDSSSRHEGYEEDESTVMPEPRKSIVPSVEESREASGASKPRVDSAPLPAAAAAAAPTTTSQTLRSRNTNTGGASSSVSSEAQAQAQSDKAETSARDTLFSKQTTSRSGTTAVSTTATTEAILDHHREEQEKLTESLLNMATALKSSSRAFASSLEGEKDVLSAATSGLDKNEQSLDAASRRMGALRRMSEGKGWWGRTLLYAWIFGLMVVAILIVFVLPKLRF
jgi:hypothetical protein